MTTTLTEQAVPTGTWTLDQVHSTVGYAVRHSGVSLFKGGLDRLRRGARDGSLRGSASVASITVQDENLEGHLLSPDFFDAERFPQVSFASTSIAPRRRQRHRRGRARDPRREAARHADRHDRRPRRGPGRHQARPLAGDDDRPHRASG